MGQKINPAFLLTAGIGSRLAPHTDKKPKPCLPFLGLPLMNYGFYLAQQAGFRDYLYNLHHLPKLLRTQISKLQPLAKSFSAQDETLELLGSGGAIWNARSNLKKSDFFLIANGDEVLIPQDHKVLSQLQQSFSRSDALCTLLVCDHPDLLKTLKPVWINSENNVLGFGMDKPSKDAIPVHYTGYKVFSSRIFDHLPEGTSNIFYEVLVKAIVHGEKVNVHKINDCHWHETGNFDSFLEASKKCLLEDLEYFNHLHMYYHQTEMELVSENKNLLYKPKKLSLPSCLNWSGTVCLAPNTNLGTNITLHNVFTEEGSSINDNTLLNDQFVLLN